MNPPTIPERLARLPELANDLWWTWNAQARDVFRKLDYALWRQTAHNPVLMLKLVSQEMLNLAAGDERYLLVYDAAVEALDAARSARDTWWHHRYPDAAGPIAYFSAEFALHQSLPIYAGVLACWPAITARRRATSDPLIGVGFMYPRVLSTSPSPPKAGNRKTTKGCRGSTRPSTARPRPTANRASSPCRSAIAACLQVWRVLLGRVKLYLLDTDLEENAPGIVIVARLYGGDRETRVQQEIILGIGGCARSKPWARRPRRGT